MFVQVCPRSSFAAALSPSPLSFPCFPPPLPPPQITFDVEDGQLQGFVDVNGIVLRRDVSDLIKLLECVLIAAVYCEEKSAYVEAIMGTGAATQTAIMMSIHRMTAWLEGGGAASPSPGSPQGVLTPSDTPTEELHTLRRVRASPCVCVGSERERECICVCVRARACLAPAFCPSFMSVFGRGACV